MGKVAWQVLFASFNCLSFEVFCGHQILLLMVSAMAIVVLSIIDCFIVVYTVPMLRASGLHILHVLTSSCPCLNQYITLYHVHLIIIIISRCTRYILASFTDILCAIILRMQLHAHNILCMQAYKVHVWPCGMAGQH